MKQVGHPHTFRDPSIRLFALVFCKRRNCGKADFSHNRIINSTSTMKMRAKCQVLRWRLLEKKRTVCRRHATFGSVDSPRYRLFSRLIYRIFHNFHSQLTRMNSWNRHHTFSWMNSWNRYTIIFDVVRVMQDVDAAWEQTCHQITQAKQNAHTKSWSIAIVAYD